MRRIIKRKSKKTQKIRFLAGDWEVFLQTMEGTKIPIFKAMSERLSFIKDFDAKICFRRYR